METYEVKKDDTLTKIAKRYGTDWKTLYNANVDTIGPDENLIIPGQVLTIPGTEPEPAPVQPDSGVVQPPVSAATGEPFATPNQDLETLVASALNATYEPQRLAINQALVNYLAQIDAANKTSETNFNNQLSALELQKTKDHAQFLQDAEHRRLKSGWHSTALAQENDAAEQSLLEAYKSARTARENEYNTALANNEATKALYTQQINDQLSQLTSQQQAEYAAKLLELQYNQQMSDRDFERQKELMAYQASLSGDEGGWERIKPNTISFNDLFSIYQGSDEYTK